MATDVSGTIHIIAEVMGDASSPISGTGSKIGPREKRQNKDDAFTFRGMQISAKTVMKVLTIGGLIAYSKVISTSINSIMQMFGAFLDFILAPLTPLFVKVFRVLFPILGYIAMFMEGEKSFSDIWNDLKIWWHKQWEEKGFWGMLKELLSTLTSFALVAILFSYVTLGKGAGNYVTRVLLKYSGVGWTMKTVTDFFGWRQNQPIRKRNIRAMKAGRHFKRKLLGLRGIMGLAGKNTFNYIFYTGALFLKNNITKALNLAVDLATVFGGKLWKGLAWTGRLFMPVLSALMAALGISISAATAGVLLLLGLVIIVAAVGTWFLVNWIYDTWIRDAFGSFFMELSGPSFENMFGSGMGNVGQLSFADMSGKSYDSWLDNPDDLTNRLV